MEDLELEWFLRSIARLCDEAPEMEAILSSRGLKVASEAWQGHSKEAISVALAFIKYRNARYDFSGTILGYRSELIDQVTAELGISPDDMHSFTRTPELDARIDADPRMTLFTRKALFSGSEPGFADAVIERRRAEVDVIGPQRILSELGVSDVSDFRELKLEQAIACISRQFISLGFNASRLKTGDLVVKYEAPSIVGPAVFYLRLKSLPGFMHYFDCDILIGVSRNLRAVVNNDHCVADAKKLTFSVRLVLQGLSAYTSSPAKLEFLGSLYAYSIAIPFLVSAFARDPKEIETRGLSV